MLLGFGGMHLLFVCGISKVKPESSDCVAEGELRVEGQLDPMQTVFIKTITKHKKTKKQDASHWLSSLMSHPLKNNTRLWPNPKWHTSCAFML